MGTEALRRYIESDCHPKIDACGWIHAQGAKLSFHRLCTVLNAFSEILKDLETRIEQALNGAAFSNDPQTRDEVFLMSVEIDCLEKERRLLVRFLNILQFRSFSGVHHF